MKTPCATDVEFFSRAPFSSENAAESEQMNESQLTSDFFELNSAKCLGA
jgi:hypothetical protein